MVYYIVLCFASIAFLGIFSVYTSPLTKLQGGDAAFFRLVGQAMTNGMLPYRDFFDMKGPYLFLIEYLSQLFCFGRFGCFIYQCINLFAILLILDRIHLIAAAGLGYIKRFILLLPYAWIMAATFEGGNLTEEFSLPFILICVYYAVKYLCTHDQHRHPARYAMLYGACFGILSLIRITNAVTICVFVLYILITLVVKKSYKNILHNAIAFIAGFVLGIAPAVLYCLYHGIFTEMLNCVFLFGLTYANEDGMIHWFFLQIDKLIFVLPLLLPTVIASVSSYKNQAIRHLIWLDLIFLLLVLSTGRSYPHYFTLIIPHTALGFVIVAHDISCNDPQAKTAHKYAAIVCVFLVSLSGMVIKHGGFFLLSSTSDRWVDHNAISIAEKIPENDRNSVYTYGIGSAWYTQTGLYPCIKYCAWQQSYIQLKPEIKDELIETFQSTPPHFVVTNKTEQPEFLQTVLNQQYYLFAENDSYDLWALTK